MSNTAELDGWFSHTQSANKIMIQIFDDLQANRPKAMVDRERPPVVWRFTEDINSCPIWQCSQNSQAKPLRSVGRPQPIQ